jgi:hypothetical protein
MAEVYLAYPVAEENSLQYTTWIFHCSDMLASVAIDVRLGQNIPNPVPMYSRLDIVISIHQPAKWGSA